jgi:hypothetical protein
MAISSYISPPLLRLDAMHEAEAKKRDDPQPRRHGLPAERKAEA